VSFYCKGDNLLETSNVQSFEKKEGVDLCVCVCIFLFNNSLSRGGDQGVYRITLTALTLNNL
jgi:hypothetical protein